VRDPLAGLEPFVEGATASQPAFIVLSRSQAEDCYLNGTLPADTMRRLETAMSGAPGFAPVYRNKDAVVYQYKNPRAEEG
jgi:hypothetical protein